MVRRDTFEYGYVKQQIRHIYHVIQDLPWDRDGRSHLGWGAELLSRITGLASQDDLDAVVEILQNGQAGVQESLKMWGDGANRLTTSFKIEESSITNVM